MQIGDAKSGDIVAIGGKLWRVMIIVSGPSVGCREVLAGRPGDDNFEMSHLHTWFSRMLEITELVWTNRAPPGVKRAVEFDPLKG